MDLTFFFTHKQQNPNGPWLTFLQSYGEHQGGYGGRTASFVLSDEQPVGEVRLRVPKGREPLRTNTLNFLNAAFDFITTDFTDVLVDDYVATFQSPLNPASMHETLTRKLPPGVSKETFAVSEDNYYPRMIETNDLFDVSYGLEVDASSGSYIKRYFVTPVTFDIDNPSALEALYGPQEDWAEPEGDHVLSLLVDNDHLQSIYDYDPYILRQDCSCSGHHYILSADSVLFQTNTTELNIELDAYYSQIFPGTFARCQADEFARLFIAPLPQSVREHFGIYHDLSDLPTVLWYSDVWLRLLSRTGSIQEFMRPTLDSERPFPPAYFHAVNWHIYQKEFTDVPLDSVTHTLIYRLESDQTAFGFADSSFISADTTELHTGDLDFNEDELTLNTFPVYASTAWVTADLWPVFASTTALFAGEFETEYSVDLWNRVVVPGFEPPDPAPPVPVNPPVNFFLPSEPASLPGFQLLASFFAITADTDIHLNDDIENQPELISVQETWICCQSLMADVEWLLADNASVTADQWDFEMQPLNPDALRQYFYTGISLPNYKNILASSSDTYTSNAEVFTNSEYVYVMAPFELVTPTWLRRLVFELEDKTIVVEETYSTEELSTHTDPILQQAANGSLSATVDQWCLDWPHLTADTWSIPLTSRGHAVDASSGWVTTDMLITVDTETALVYENFLSSDYCLNETFVSNSWQISVSDPYADQFVHTAGTGLTADAIWHINSLIDPVSVAQEPLLLVSFLALSADMSLRVNDRTYEVVTLETEAVYDPLRSLLILETDLGYTTLPSLFQYENGDSIAILASNQEVFASSWLTTDRLFYVVERFEPTQTPVFEPRLFVLDDAIILEEGDHYVDLALFPSNLFDGSAITLRVSYSVITADIAFIRTNDLTFELLFVEPDDAPPPLPIVPSEAEPPSNSLTPGGPYTALFRLPAYLYPTHQRQFHFSSDLDFLVLASAWITADATFTDLPGILPHQPYQLQTHFDVSSDAFFSIDQDYITADNHEVFFPLTERLLLPRACSYKPGGESITADNEFFRRQRWLNPWWTALESTNLIDWPYATDLTNEASGFDVPRVESNLGLFHRVMHVENLPLGDLYVSLGEDSTAYLPEGGRGFLPASRLNWQMPGSTLPEIAAGLIGLLSLNQTWVALKTIDELIYIWGDALNNCIEDVDGLHLNPAVTWGLPYYLPRDGNYSEERDVFGMAWLGFALTQACHYFADRPDSTRVDLPPKLGLMLEQLAFLVANAIDPVQGWCIRLYNETGQLSGPTDYPSTVMAVIFLSEYLSLVYDSEIHDRAAIAYISIAEGPTIPRPEIFGLETQRTLSELITYKLLWAARFNEQLDVETLISQVSQEADRDNPFLACILKELDFPIPLTISYEVRSANLVWRQDSPDLWASSWANIQARGFPLFANPPFRLYAHEASAHLSYAYQLQRWLWPFGYRWLTWKAEEPQGGTLGKLLYSMAFLAYFWALRYNLVRDSRSITLSQGWALDEWGKTLDLQRRPYEGDHHYRKALLGWLNLDRGTANGVKQLVLERHELPFLLLEPSLALFVDGIEERQGSIEDGVYYPYNYVRSAWLGSPQQVDYIQRGGRRYPLLSSNQELTADQDQFYLTSRQPTQLNPEAEVATVPLFVNSEFIDDFAGQPGFFAVPRASSAEIDTSEAWLTTNSSDVFWPLQESSQTVELLVEGYSPKLLSELHNVSSLGYVPQVRLLKGGRQASVIMPETVIQPRSSRGTLSAVATTVFSLSLEPHDSADYLTNDLVLSLHLEEL